MRIKKVYIAFMLLLTTLLVAGCGNRREENSAKYSSEFAETYERTNREMEEEKDYVSRGHSNAADAAYNAAFDEIFSYEDSWNMDEWEGDSIWEKYELKILSWIGNVYGFVKAYFLIILLVNCMLAAFLYAVSLAIKDKQIGRLGVVGIGIIWNFFIIVFLLGFGIFNNYYI